MTKHSEVPVTSESTAAKPLPGWRILYYVASAMCGLFLIAPIITGILWASYRKDAVYSKIHRLAFVLSAVSVAITVMMALSLGLAMNHAIKTAGNSTTPVTSYDPVATQAPVENSQTLAPMGPGEAVSPEGMATSLAQLRRDAFCTGGAEGQAMLDQVWAYHEAPHILSFQLQDAVNSNALAPLAPHSTYAADLEQMKNYESGSFTGSECNHAPRSADMTITEAYTLGVGTRVVCSTFLSNGSLYDGYTAVYVLKSGHWYIDQMH